jgi:opacity protein-like surface antigen
MKRAPVIVGIALLSSGTAEAKDLSLGLGAGVVDPQGVRTAPWFTANLRWALSKRVVIEPEAGYWKKSETSADLTSSVRDVSGGVNVLYRAPRKGATWFAGAGVGLHLVRSEFALGAVSDTDTQLKSALHLIAGLELDLGGALALFGAVRYDTVSDVQQNKVYAGIRVGG